MSNYRTVRITRPEYSSGIYGSTGGLGPVRRRGWDERTNRMIALAEERGMTGLKHFYETAPLRLLKVLMTVHPMGKMAHSNNAAAVCSPGDTKFIAERTEIDPATRKKTKVADSEETDEYEAFLEKYPGGLPGLQRALLKQLEWSGQICLEGVPGPRLQGVGRALTFDPLSFYYNDKADGTQEKLQYSYSLAGSMREAMPGSDTLLDPETVYVSAIDYDDDNPYGDPIFGSFTVEAIKDLGQERNLSDILKGWAYPHVSIGFPVDEVIERATKNPELCGEMSPEEYAEQEFNNFMDWLACINPDDPLVMPKGSEAKVLDSGSGIAALDPAMKMRRHRMVMSLDQLPGNLGITDGGTQAYSEEQGKQQAKKLEFVRGLINAAIVWLLNLHSRLRGKNVTARAECQPIRPGDRLMDANARKVEVDTDLLLREEGYFDDNTVSVKHTGKAPARKLDPDRPSARSKRKADKAAGNTTEKTAKTSPATTTDPGEE